MRFLLLSLMLLGIPPAAGAAEVERADIIDKGIYEIVAGEATADPKAPTGTVTAVESEKLVQATDTVAGKVGVEFGFRYTIAGEPSGEPVKLDIVITYPAPGLKNPGESAPTLETRYSRDKTIGETLYCGYGFENDWEVVPGKWTFAIWHDGRKLAEESFTVTAP
jgi:hypothetical protein